MKMKKSFLLSILSSMSIHLAIVALSWLIAKKYADQPYHTEQITEIMLIDDIDEAKQIVEQIENNNIASQKANFLGKNNNQTERETIKPPAAASSFRTRNAGVAFKKSIQTGGTIPVRSKDVNSFGRMLASASMRAEDNYLEVEKGDKTSLNTKEFLYFTYYSLIKEQLQGYWEYHIRQKINQLIMTNVDHVELNKRAKLLIILNSAGFLKGLTIVKQSGLPELDEAAVNTVQEAKPFPPPPKGLVQDGQVVIGWEFVVYEQSQYF